MAENTQHSASPNLGCLACHTMTNEETIRHILILANRIDERTGNQSMLIEEMRKKLDKIDIDNITEMKETLKRHDRQISIWKGALGILSAAFTVFVTWFINVYK